jgi:translation initiation factor IF-3
LYIYRQVAKNKICTCKNLLYLFGGFLAISKDSNILVNEQIRLKEVRLISYDGTQLGIVNTSEALKLAKEKDLDLVMVSPNAVPPVCKIMDFGRHKYEQEKKNKEAKKKQHVVVVKELTLSYKIAEHDFQVRLKQIQKFIEHGYKVKLTVKLKGREEQYAHLAINLLNKFAKEVENIANIERTPKHEGKQVIMIITPKKGG